jgi:hypothetical protein
MAVLTAAADKEVRFLAILAKLEEVVALKEQLGGQLKRGHLHLAQAKYATIPGAIGQASYSGNLQPLVSVSSAYPDSSDSLYPRFSASSPPPQSSEESDGTKGSEAAAAGAQARGPSSAERSNDCRPSDQQQPEASSRSNEAQQQGAPQSQQTLLQMFGFLTPPALKLAQASFTELLPSVLRLANLQQELLELADEQAEDE